jgi:hypothetical protein
VAFNLFLLMYWWWRAAALVATQGVAAVLVDLESCCRSHFLLALLTL